MEESYGDIIDSEKGEMNETGKGELDDSSDEVEGAGAVLDTTVDDCGRNDEFIGRGE
jgi:hypothetical protein